jgi:hypothetical protein
MLRLAMAFFTALFAAARETEPVLGATWTFRLATERLTSVFEAADFSLVLDDVASVLPALLVAAYVRTIAPGMYAPYINVSLSITLIKLIHLNDRFLNRNTYKYANKKIVNIPLMKYIEANYNLIVTHSSCFYIDQINTLITPHHEWLPCRSNGTLLNNTQFQLIKIHQQI